MQLGGNLERHQNSVQKTVVQGDVQRRWAVRPAIPLIARFAGKFMLDIMPAALASVVGGFLFTQYQFGHSAPAHPALEQVMPASAEMMAMVRDEHAMIVDYLKTQMTAEKNKQAAEDAADVQAAEAPAPEIKAAEAVRPVEARVPTEAPVRRIQVMAVAKPVASHTKSAAAAPRTPLVIAQVDQMPAPSPQANTDDRLARDPNSLLAKTLDLKDNVVSATRHVVGMIGDVFGSIGERLGGNGAAPDTRQFSSESWNQLPQ